MRAPLELDADVSRVLEEAFTVCPECRAPWSLHWRYVREGNGLRRRYNTCGLSRIQLEAKYTDQLRRRA